MDAGQDGRRDALLTDTQADALGKRECRVEAGGRCPAGCLPLAGRQLDTKRLCSLPEVPAVLCTNRSEVDVAYSCLIRHDTGEVFWINDGAAEPYYAGWRDCTKEEFDRYFPALSKECP